MYEYGTDLFRILGWKHAVLLCNIFWRPKHPVVTSDRRDTQSSPPLSRGACCWAASAVPVADVRKAEKSSATATRRCLGSVSTCSGNLA